MRPGGQLERTLVELVSAAATGQNERKLALRATKSGEYDQQVQERFSGQATGVWGYADIPVSWEHPIVYSPLQRNPQFKTPHVSDHIEFTGILSDLVIAKAHVIAWQQSKQGWFTGAKVRLAACAPTALDPVTFAGVMHLIFQGFAYPTDEELST